MKHLIKKMVPVTAVILLAACGDDTATKGEMGEHDGHDHAKIEEMHTPASTSPVLKDEKMNAVYQHYVHLTTALTNSDMGEAKIAANAIEAGAKEVSGAEAIASSASKITAASDLEVQRKHYEDMSNAMITLLKKDGLSNGEVYVQYCPMAFNDKGASWISSSKEIRNPYFGDKMMNCGEVKETIQ